MATYPIKLLKDESGIPFVPLTQVSAVIGKEYILSTFAATQLSTGHFQITNDKMDEDDISEKVIAVIFPEDITATTNSYLKFNEGTEYLIQDETGTGPLLVNNYAGSVCFLTKHTDSWQFVKTGASGGSGGGHSIVDGDGNVLTQRAVLKFEGFGVSDDASIGATVISTPALVNNLTTSESNTGPLDAYQGYILNNKLDNTVKNYLPLKGGTLTGHLYLNGVATGALNSTSMLVFGDTGSVYNIIAANQAGQLCFCNSLTDKSHMITYGGDSNSFRPSSNNTTATLGLSSNRWDKLYVNKINLATSQYMTDGDHGINMNNSDIIGINGLYFEDATNSTDEGILFYRDGTNWDTFRIYNGVPYLNLNHELGGATGTQYTMLHSGNYSSYALPKSGGTMTGNISYANGDYTDYEMIKWKTGDNNGAGVVIGGGGAVVIGGGESATRVYDGVGLTGSSEVMYITNDQAINFYPGQQSGYTTAGLFSIAAGGALTKCNGVNVPGVFIQSSTPTAKQTGDIWFVT